MTWVVHLILWPNIGFVQAPKLEALARKAGIELMKQSISTIFISLVQVSEVLNTIEAQMPCPRNPNVDAAETCCDILKMLSLV